MNTVQSLSEEIYQMGLRKAHRRVNKIIEDVTKSIEDGFMGKTFGFHLTKIEQDLLEKEHGFKTKTFCSYDSDDFQECSVWIEL